MRIVHLASDEKIVPMLRGLFEEALPGANHWLIARRRSARQHFMAAAPDVTLRPGWWFRTPLVARDLAGADVVFAHGMAARSARALRYAPRSARIVWKGWGYDYARLLEPFVGGMLLPATRALLGSASDGPSEAAGRSHWQRLWQRLWQAIRSRRQGWNGLQGIAARIHTFGVLPTEEAVVRRALPGLTAVHHEIPLYTTEDVFERGPAAMDGPDILLGNSATASNNHADAFAFLRGRLADGRLVVPLSYGPARYRDSVVALGRQAFGDRFDPLLDWMSLDDYNRRIGRCGFVVMNHRRQQGVGNIGSALYKGATVYLRRESPLFDFYTGLGATVRATNALEDGQPLMPLTADEKARNRAVVGAHYARERVLKAIRTLPALLG